MRNSDLLSSINLPDLISAHCGTESVRGLHHDQGGAICDPRPGHHESNPSFSVYKRKDIWYWKRFGGDGASGNAYSFLLELGFTRKQAMEELHRFAGVPLEDRRGRFSSPQPRFVPTPPSALDEAQHALSRYTSLNALELHKAKRLLAPLTAKDQAAQGLQARGLYGWEGLDAHQLRHPFRTRCGDILAHAGALAFMLTGPNGQITGLKIRNHGTKAELEQAGLKRYSYRLAGHGAPAWCSPGYGQGKVLLIVEGELNGAAASRAGRFVGLSLDVQGLAGAHSVPYLEGMAGRVVYLHFDPDEAGAAGLARVGQIAKEAGATEVKVLPPMQEGDFCDVLGEIGLFKFGSQLMTALQSAKNLLTDLGPHPDSRPMDVPKTTLSGTTSSIWGQQNKSSQSIWSARRRLF